MKKAKYTTIKAGKRKATGITQRADKKRHAKDITTVMMQEVITTARRSRSHGRREGPDRFINEG